MKKNGISLLVSILCVCFLSCFPRLTEFSDNPYAPEHTVPSIFVKAGADEYLANGSFEYPYPTINEGINAAINTQNKNVFILSGDYYEHIKLKDINDLNIIGENVDTVILFSTNAEYAGLWRPNIYIDDNTNNINISTLTLKIRPDAYTNNLIEISSNSGELFLDSINIDAAGLANYGIIINNSWDNQSNLVITNCNFDNFILAGIFLYPKNVYIEDTTFNMQASLSYGIEIFTDDSVINYQNKILDVKNSTFNLLQQDTSGIYFMNSMAYNINIGTINSRANIFNGQSFIMSSGLNFYNIYEGNLNIIPDENGNKNYFNNLEKGIILSSIYNLNINIDSSNFYNNMYNDIIIIEAYDNFISIKNNFFTGFTSNSNISISSVYNTNYGFLELINNYMDQINNVSIVSNNMNTDWYIYENYINSILNDINGKVLLITQEVDTYFINLYGNTILSNNNETYAIGAAGMYPYAIKCTGENIFQNIINSSYSCSSLDGASACNSYCF